MANRITSLCIDVTDADLVAGFWTEVLGWPVTERDDEGVRIQDGPDARFAIDFLVVPDGPKGAKNRLHLDVNATDRDQAAELERLLALGARPVDVGQSADVSWHVLADPEGNEFCLLRTRVDP
jgi:catechol 2,3-dioxygenase-like lactoylglutathione lyase family enzyme